MRFALIALLLTFLFQTNQASATQENDFVEAVRKGAFLQPSASFPEDGILFFNILVAEYAENPVAQALDKSMGAFHDERCGYAVESSDGLSYRMCFRGHKKCAEAFLKAYDHPDSPQEEISKIVANVKEVSEASKP